MIRLSTVKSCFLLLIRLQLVNLMAYDKSDDYPNMVIWLLMISVQMTISLNRWVSQLNINKGTFENWLMKYKKIQSTTIPIYVCMYIYIHIYIYVYSHIFISLWGSFSSTDDYRNDYIFIQCAPPPKIAFSWFKTAMSLWFMVGITIVRWEPFIWYQIIVDLNLINMFNIV